MQPAPGIMSILSGAYRCSAFDSVCYQMLWCPELGHIPRGYTGAIGTVRDVQLVICLAEPGNPGKNECYPFSKADEFIQVCRWGCCCRNRQRRTRFPRESQVRSQRLLAGPRARRPIEAHLD